MIDLDYGVKILGEGISKLGVVATNVAATMSEKSREFSAGVQQHGLVSEVQDISAKGWDWMSNVVRSAKEQIIGAGITITS